jgi:hypothetical protein
MKMPPKLQRWVINLVAKRVIKKIGEEKWEASKTRVSAIVALLAFGVQTVLPEFGVTVPIPDGVLYLLQVLGVGGVVHGIRDSNEKLDEHLCEIEAKLEKKK